MDAALGSVGSTLSWNTALSRTSVSTITCDIFSEWQSHSVHGLEDVIRAVGSLQLRRYRYEELAREETLGQGETYLVEKAVHGSTLFAVKHLKISSTPDEKSFRRRLSAVIVEARILRHPPLRAHPNLPSVIGYGWNLRGQLVIPFLVVEYAPFGTLREYIRKLSPTLSDIAVLLGDVASALAALHVCGIVHGDVKLDNVLVFPSSDRPTTALAKLTDFGHALILNDKSKRYDDEIPKYGGTVIYNAPEVKTQDLVPIRGNDLKKCDIWAFGLLTWEACIGGEDYIKYLARNGVVANTSGNDPGISGAEVLNHAKRCLPTRRPGTAMLLQIVLHKTLQEDSSKRATNIRNLPLFTKWNAGNLLGPEGDLALHFEASKPTYEMFRLDTGGEILWDHQQQIFQGLKHTNATNPAGHRGPISWQIALCHHFGFGTGQDPRSARECTEMAKSEFHPLAMAFGQLLSPRMNGPEPPKQYAVMISRLLRDNITYSKTMPRLVRAFFDGNSAAIFDLLSEGVPLSSSAVDGCSPLHWLFMFQDTALEELAQKLSGKVNRRLFDLLMCSKDPVHYQWPLKLVGTPLAVAISVNSLPAVKTLLSLGADPLSLAYGQEQFSSEDPRSRWTAFHIAAKYHCSEILAYLLKQANFRQQASIDPLACVLSLSTTLERLAMHGSNHTKQLDKTIRLIREIWPLGAMDTFGRTGLMVAIDYQDYHVVAALLRADKDLAKAPFRSPNSPVTFTYPIHFSAQIAARRDVSETLLIPKLLNSYTDILSCKESSRDHMGRTPLHLAVTGPSSAVASWILGEDVELMHIEDVFGRSPLHYCASPANVDLFLDKGANINHVDKRGITALHRFCSLGAPDLVASLLERRPRLDLKDDIHGTPLHCGVISGSIDVVMALVEHGAPLNAADMNGNTAAHVAAKLNRHQILRILIQHGADTSSQNVDGQDQNIKTVTLHAGRDPEANIGQSAFPHEKRVPHESQSILETEDDDGKTSRFENQATGDLPSDFLCWGDSMSVAGSSVSIELSQSIDTESYVHGEQLEKYEQRRKKLEKLDLIAGTVTGHLPSLYRRYMVTTTVVAILSVFFDDIIWEPSISGRIIEVIARAAHDLANMFQFCVGKARRIQQRVEAWAEFLTRHDGILLRHQQKLDSLWYSIEESDPVEIPEQGVTMPEEIDLVEVLDQVAKQSEESSPVETPDQIGEEPEHHPNTKRAGIETSQEEVSLETLLHYIEETFISKTEGAPAHWNRNVEDLTAIEICTMLEGEDMVVGEEWEVNQTEGREVERRQQPDAGEGESSLEKLRREKRNQESQPERPKRYDPCRQDAMTYYDRIDLAIHWISTIVMDRKPRTIFPGRKQSEIEDMARLEIKTWKPATDEISQPSTTLFDIFPQVLEPSWRESTFRDYFKWEDKKTFGILRDDYHARWVAQTEFFEELHESCMRMI